MGDIDSLERAAEIGLDTQIVFLTQLPEQAPGEIVADFEAQAVPARKQFAHEFDLLHADPANRLARQIAEFLVFGIVTNGHQNN